MTTYDFSVVRRAGLTQDEFAKIMKVSRQTVNRWMAGYPPGEDKVTRLTRVLARLEEAIDAGHLPVKPPPHALTQIKIERRRAIADALR